MKNWQDDRCETALLGLGSNIGDRLENLSLAIRFLRKTPGIRLGRVSRVWRSAPAGYRAQRWFYNAAMRIRTNLSGKSLVSSLKKAERALGRRKRVTNGPREIDIDLLLLGRRRIHSISLTVPHPRMHLRRFVLAPASEIATSMIHPVSGKSVGALLRGLGKTGSAIALNRQEHLRFRAMNAERN